MEVATNFWGYEGNLEEPGAKDWRGVTFPIHLHQLLIMKSKSDNLLAMLIISLRAVLIKTYNGLLV